MKLDRISQLHSKKSKDLRKSWYHYNYSIIRRKRLGLPVEFDQPVSFQEYVSMKKERSRRIRISETVFANSFLKSVGLTSEQIRAFNIGVKKREGRI